MHSSSFDKFYFIIARSEVIFHIDDDHFHPYFAFIAHKLKVLYFLLSRK